MATTEIGEALLRDINADLVRIEFTVGITEYDGFIVQETELEATSDRTTDKNEAGNTITEAFYDLGKTRRVTALVQSGGAPEGFEGIVPHGTIVAMTNAADSTQEFYLCVGSTEAQSAGSAYRITLDLELKDSLSSTLGN